MRKDMKVGRGKGRDKGDMEGIEGWNQAAGD
jgi:hypothetical protein